MKKFLLSQKNLKAILLPLSIGFFAFQVGSVIPNMLTLSLSSWIRMAFSIVPAVFVLLVIAIWNPSEQQLRLKISVSSFRPALPPVTYLLFVIIIALLCGFVIFWSISNFPTFVLSGQIVLFGSMLLMLILGLVKPELGPATFIALNPFLMFSEARLSSSASWSIFGETVLCVPDWLQRTLFGLENVNIVLFMFTVGFVFYCSRKSANIGTTPIDKPIFLLLIWTLLSTLTADDSLEGLRSYLIRWLFPVSVYYATFFAIQRTNGIREIKLAFLILLFLSCLLSIQNAALSGETVLVIGERAKIWTVIGGQMGPWSALTIPLIFSLLLDRKYQIYIRVFCLVAIIMALIMAVWEMQRVIMLDFALMVVLVFILYHHKFWWNMVLYASLGIIALFFIYKLTYLVEIMRPEIVYTNPFAPHANEDRLYLFEKGWDIVRNNPFFGIGPGGFTFRQIGLFKAEVSSHNMFLETALESGILASFLFAMIIFTPIVKFAKSFLKGTYSSYEEDLRPWIISLVVYCFHLMFHTNWDWGYGVAIFSILGIILGTMRNAENKARTAQCKNDETKGESRGIYGNV